MTWGVPSGLPSEVRKVGLSTPRPFNPPSRNAIRLVVLIANGTSDFASERSDAKSHVRNRQDGPDIMHLKRTENVRFGNIVEQSPFLSWTDS